MDQVPKPVQTKEELSNAVQKALESLTGGGSAIPKAWAFGKPMTEEEFKEMRENQGINTTKKSDILKMKLRQQIKTKTMQRTTKTALSSTLKNEMTKVQNLTKDIKETKPDDTTEKTVTNTSSKVVIEEIEADS